MGRTYWILSGVFGAAAVLLGAVGAHALGAAEAEAAALAWWKTAAHYHLTHALGLAVAAHLADRSLPGARAAGLCFAAGVVLFSGSLYTMTLTGQRWLGAVTPAGGLLLVAGWVLVGRAAWSLPR